MTDRFQRSRDGLRFSFDALRLGVDHPIDYQNPRDQDERGENDGLIKRESWHSGYLLRKAFRRESLAHRRARSSQETKKPLGRDKQHRGRIRATRANGSTRHFNHNSELSRFGKNVTAMRKAACRNKQNNRDDPDNRTPRRHWRARNEKRPAEERAFRGASCNDDGCCERFIGRAGGHNQVCGLSTKQPLQPAMLHWPTGCRYFRQ